MKGASRGVCVICRQAPLDDLRAHQCASTLHKESSHLRGSLLIKEQTHERRLRAASAYFTRNPPTYVAPPYENKKRHRNASLLYYLHHYVCIKRIPTAALSASGCGSKRSASSQPANSPAPHILSNSLTTSIPLSDRNINIFFCDVTPYATTHY